MPARLRSVADAFSNKHGVDVNVGGERHLHARHACKSDTNARQTRELTLSKRTDENIEEKDRAQLEELE